MTETKNEENNEIEITAYKGFDKNLQCRGFQYEVGKTYEYDGDTELCNSGFHACQEPLYVFGFYSPGTSRFCEVVLSGEIKSDEQKTVASKITIKAELTLSSFILNAAECFVKSVLALCKKTKANTGNKSAATNTGNKSAATNTGSWSAATNTGSWSAATNTGNQSAATNTGHQSAATNTGDQSAATNTGDQSAATSMGDQSAASVEGKESIAFVAGRDSKASASKGSWIVLTERNEDGTIVSVKTAKAGRDVKADTFYKLINGEFVEVEE